MNKYWQPLKQINNYLGNMITKDMKVLELGPSIIPFQYATHYCGWDTNESNKLPNYKIVDFSKDKFPYDDKEFDFTYARHVLEDLYNPFHCMEEISRISKAGYIECPSPIAEICMNAENYPENSKIRWKGYNHHYYMVWNEDNKLNFLHKFPSVEIFDSDQKNLEKILENPLNWNSYYIWKDKIEYKHFQHSKDFECPIAPSYSDLIERGAKASLNFNEQFRKDLIK